MNMFKFDSVSSSLCRFSRSTLLRSEDLLELEHLWVSFWVSFLSPTSYWLRKVRWQVSGYWLSWHKFNLRQLKCVVFISYLIFACSVQLVQCWASELSLTHFLLAAKSQVSGYCFFTFWICFSKLVFSFSCASCSLFLSYGWFNFISDLLETLMTKIAQSF